MIFSMNKSYFIFPLDTPMLFTAIFLLMTLIFLIIIIKKVKVGRMRLIGIWFLCWLFVGTIMFGVGTFGRFVDVKNKNSKTYTKVELTKDLQQLEKCIMKENPLYFANKEELQLLFNDAYENLKDGMTELEFYRLVNPIVASVNCGHTNLSISEALVENRKATAKFFPLKVTLVGNQLYFLEGDASKAIAAGDEIKAINGKSSDEIISILLKNISGDSKNEAKRRYIIGKDFNSRFYDFVDNTDNFRVELITKEGPSKIVDLQAKFREEFNTTAWELHFTEYADGNYYESKIYENYALLTIHIFFQESDCKFEDFLEEFFTKVKDKNITKLVLDLRGNLGADPFMAKTLLSYFVTENTRYFNDDLTLIHRLFGFTKPVSPAEASFEGDMVILTDGACFSTTAHLCALLKYHNLGTFVGSETGGTFVCTDSSKDDVLNHTRLRLHYSTLKYTAAVDGLSKTSGIMPDVNISPSVEDILEKKDVIMEKGLQVLEVK